MHCGSRELNARLGLHIILVTFLVITMARAQEKGKAKVHLSRMDKHHQMVQAHLPYPKHQALMVLMENLCYFTLLYSQMLLNPLNLNVSSFAVLRTFSMLYSSSKRLS